MLIELFLNCTVLYKVRSSATDVSPVNESSEAPRTLHCSMLAPCCTARRTLLNAVARMTAPLLASLLCLAASSPAALHDVHPTCDAPCCVAPRFCSAMLLAALLLAALLLAALLLLFVHTLLCSSTCDHAIPTCDTDM
jgi:hypothetical protein